MMADGGNRIVTYILIQYVIVCIDRWGVVYILKLIRHCDKGGISSIHRHC